MNAKTRRRYDDIKIWNQRNRLRKLDKRLHKHTFYSAIQYQKSRTIK